MDATGCINNEAWQDYAAGKLDEHSKEQLLRHAASCAICADILEGINLLEKPALLEQRVRQINQAVDLHTSITKTRSINKIWYAAAAILVMACGLGWYLFTPQTEQPIALRQQPEQSPEKPAQHKEETIRSKDVPAAPPRPHHSPEPDKASAKLPAPPQPMRAEQVLITSKHAIVDAEEQKPEVVTKALSGIADASIQEQRTDKEADKQAVTQQTEIKETSSRNVSQQKVTAKKSKETYPSAYSANNNAGLNNPNFRGVTGTNIATPDSAVYRLALAQYESGQYDSSRITLSVIVANPRSAYYEDGMLLAAKAHIATGEKAAAKTSLQMVIGLNGNRKKEAQDLLDTLK